MYFSELLDKTYKLLPSEHHLLWRDLHKMVEDAFLILPEDEFSYYVKASHIMGKHIVGSESAIPKLSLEHIIKIWQDFGKNYNHRKENANDRIA